MRKVLFYLEPVVFRDNPDLISSWHHFSRHISLMSQNRFRSVLVSSQTICCLPSSGFDKVISLDTLSYLAAHDFVRSDYAKDLNSPYGRENQGLLRDLQALRSEELPDIVISWSENRYLKMVFNAVPVLFLELGPLPRTSMKWSAYLDSGGSQIDSTFERVAEKPSYDPLLNGLLEKWNAGWLDRIKQRGAENGLSDWLSNVAHSRNIALLVLQPEDWLTYEGLGINIKPLDLVRKIAYEFGPSWVIVPQWHAESIEPTDSAILELEKTCTSVAVPPQEFRAHTAELFIPWVKRVVTVSSNVAVAAAISGKEVHIVGQGKLKPLDTRSTGCSSRADLLFFLISNYCQPIQEWTDVQDAFADHLDRVISQHAVYFDFSNVDVSLFERFLIPE